MLQGLATVPALGAIPRLLHGFGRRAPGPSKETREETARRVAASLDGDGRLLLLRQVHGAAVALAPWNGAPEADAAVAAQPGLMLGIQTADCLPVLLVDPQRRQVAAAHAGWRGTAAGVTRQAVDQWIARTPGLTLRKLGRARLLTAADCRRILARPHKKMGRPKKVVDTRQAVA